MLLRCVNVLLASALACCAMAEDKTLDLYALGVAHHWLAQDAHMKDFNPGLGFGLSFIENKNVDLSFKTLVYYDSFGNRACAVAVGAGYYIGKRESYHGLIELDAGSLSSTGYEGFIVTPIVGFGYKRLSIEGIYNPHTEVAGAWLAYRLPLP